MSVSRETSILELADDLEAELAALADWLAIRAGRLGLTNFTSPQQMLIEALQPALAPIALLNSRFQGTWADFGAGCGAIGLTLAYAAPNTTITLIDRRQQAIAFIDLTICRFDISNATPLHINLNSTESRPSYTGVCFRAVTEPAAALKIAATHATDYICAWHSPNIRQYHSPPEGFAHLKQIQTPSPNLVATLYRRSG